MLRYNYLILKVRMTLFLGHSFNFLHDSNKYIHQLGVELGSGAAFDFGECFAGGELRFVGAVVGHDIVGVCDGYDAGQQGDICTTEAIRVAGAVPVLMMMKDEG